MRPNSAWRRRRATAEGSRGAIAFGRLTAGPFAGELVFNFYAGSPLILVEAVVSTSEDRRAILYDAGLVAAPDSVQHYAWADFDDSEKSHDAASPMAAEPRSVRYRTVVAQMAGGGAVAVFPPPPSVFFIRSILPRIMASIGSDAITRPRPRELAGACASRLRGITDLPPGSTRRRAPPSGWGCFICCRPTEVRPP